MWIVIDIVNIGFYRVIVMLILVIWDLIVKEVVEFVLGGWD